jgi:hypothetical protein
VFPPLSKLGSEVAREQDGNLRGMHLSELDLLRGMGRSRYRSQRRWLVLSVWTLVLVVAVTTLVAAGNAVFPRLDCRWLPAADADKLGMDAAGTGQAGRWVAAPEGQPSRLAFTDQSSVALQPKSRLRVMKLGHRGADLSLEAGSASIRVEGSRFTEYHLWVGPFELILPRGHAQVTWDPMTLQLDLVVHEGYVVIAGCQFGEGRSVAAGKELATRCSAP